MGGVTSPEAVAVVPHLADDQHPLEECEVGDGPPAVSDVELHLADGQQHNRKSVRWEMVPLL